MGYVRRTFLKGFRGAIVISLIAALLASTPGTASAAGPPVFINEIHYDNAGGDVGEGFEIAGPAGTNLAGWTVALYNGSASQLSVYATINLAGTIPNQQGGFGTLSFLQAGIQNGAPDGIALVDAGSSVIEFLSYEGSFTAGSGPATGLTSTDIGVSEPNTTPVGDSLQLAGSGTGGDDFTWAPSQPATFGGVNTGQTFGVVTGPTDPLINEFVSNHTGSDTEAFVEVLGGASTDYSAFTILEIEGDSSGDEGTIDAVLPVGTTNGSGYWIDPEDMENGTVTILLVENFTGSSGDDIDTDDDGIIDASPPWTRIVDDIATNDGGSGDLTYASTVLAAFFDGEPFSPGGASRIPNGTDTDTTADWVRNDFDGFGFLGFSGSPEIGEAVNTPSAVNVAVTVAVDPVGICNAPATLIHDIQGSGAASPDVGNIREIEGIVTGDFEGSNELSGFFMQEESADFDVDATTSEGIFVFNNSLGSVSPGDTVRVRGSVTEFFDLTEINNVVSVTQCTATGTTAPAAWSLPVNSVDDWEYVEGMEISISQTLYASGNFTQGRFGEVDLSIGGPLDNPTNVVAPGAAANALQDLNNRSRIQLDDGSGVQNPLPLPPYLGAGNTLRTGDTLPGITANVSFSFGNYQLEPSQLVTFTRDNARPAVPNVGGRIQVASANVLNYFTTIDNSGPICGPAANQDCRGADTAAEFTQQRDKLITEITGFEAEVIGLMEIENNATNGPEADLVAGLNAATAPGTYDYIATGPIGTDAIRVAMLYQPAAVTPVGAFAVLDSSIDPRFDDDRNRPMLVQTFMENATGSTFTVAVNHLKSKGSNCNSAGDPDTGDGQGNCNVTRTDAAEAIVDFMATDPTGSGNDNYLIIGDLNAYAQEDPVTTIEAGGYTDLIEAFVGTGVADGAYSFNFFSQSGYLDHALASPTMVARVTGAAFWHVNSDEPSGLDYNNFNQPGLYSPDEFRSSDHDPVLVGLELDTPMSLKEAALDDLAASLPTGDSNDDKKIEKAIERIDQSLNPAWWTGFATLDLDDGKFVFDREHQAVVELEKVGNALSQAAIDRLLLADSRMARIQLDIAINAGGDPKSIAKAEANLEDAAANIANGDFANAILDYKKAWTNAVKAL